MDLYSDWADRAVILKEAIKESHATANALRLNQNQAVLLQPAELAFQKIVHSGVSTPSSEQHSLIKASRRLANQAWLHVFLSCHKGFGVFCPGPSQKSASL